LDPEEKRTRSRAAARRYRTRNPEKTRAATRKWREENRETFLASNRKSKKKYYARNSEKIIEWQHEYTKRNYERLHRGWISYSESHREEARQRARAWRIANPQRVKAISERRRATGYYRQPERRAKSREWVERNRDRVRDTLRASRLRRRAQGGEGLSAADWRAILVFWEHRCAYCGIGGKLEADHRIPLARGGTSAKENIIPACPRCNRRKNTMTEDEFRLFLVLEREPLDILYRWQEAS